MDLASLCSTALHLSGLFDVAVSAVSRALMARQKSMYLLGVIVTAVIAAIVGSTVRDALLDPHHPYGY